jgi:hypothetical protein
VLGANTYIIYLRIGQVERVRECLAADPQLVHARGGDGQSPLHFASTVEIAGLLLVQRSAPWLRLLQAAEIGDPGTANSPLTVAFCAA